HRAAGAAPLEPGVDEHLVQTERFGRAADPARARHDERLDMRCDVMAPYDARGFLEIRQPAVRARADECHIDPGAPNARARPEPHELERLIVGVRADRL